MRVSGGFLLLLAVLVYLDEGIGLLLPGLAACLVHELGHILVIRMVGGRIERLELTAAGAVLVLDTRFPLSYLKEAVSALADFLCGGAAICFGHYLLAGLNLAVGMFNFLPIWPMDGGRVLYSLLSNCWDAGRTEKCMAVISAGLVGVLFWVGLVLMIQWGNPTLIVTSAMLLIYMVKNYF